MTTEKPEKKNPADRPPTLWDTIKSVNAAFIGVQSSKNRERDFTKGKASHFIIVGVVMTVVFVFVVMFFVKLALKNAGM